MYFRTLCCLDFEEIKYKILSHYMKIGTNSTSISSTYFSQKGAFFDHENTSRKLPLKYHCKKLVKNIEITWGT